MTDVTKQRVGEIRGIAYTPNIFTWQGMVADLLSHIDAQDTVIREAVGLLRLLFEQNQQMERALYPDPEYSDTQLNADIRSLLSRHDIADALDKSGEGEK